MTLKIMNVYYNFNEYNQPFQPISNCCHLRCFSLNIMSCFITSCLVISCLIMSCLVMSYLVCLITSWYHVMSHPVMSHHVMSHPVMSHHVMSFHVNVLSSVLYPLLDIFPFQFQFCYWRGELAMYFNSVSIIVLQCISVSISIRQVFQFQFCYTSISVFISVIEFFLFILCGIKKQISKLMQQVEK